MHQELYDKIVAAWKKQDMPLFNGLCNIWLSSDPENPFPSGSPEANHFFNALKNYRLWKKGGVGDRLSKIQMSQALRELMTICPKNPYKPEQPKVVLEEPAVMLGVPEKKNGLFRKKGERNESKRHRKETEGNA